MEGCGLGEVFGQLGHLGVGMGWVQSGRYGRSAKEDWRGNGSGRDAIDGDAVLAKLHPRHFGGALHAGLGDGIEIAAHMAAQGGNR